MKIVHFILLEKQQLEYLQGIRHASNFLHEFVVCWSITELDSETIFLYCKYKELCRNSFSKVVSPQNLQWLAEDGHVGPVA